MRNMADYSNFSSKRYHRAYGRMIYKLERLSLIVFTVLNSPPCLLVLLVSYFSRIVNYFYITKGFGI